MTFDPKMPEVASQSHVSIVLNHIQGKPRQMQESPEYEDVVSEIRNFLAGRVETMESLGIPKEKIAVDPGIGFGKQLEHNYQIIANLEKFSMIECPLLLGLSRKSFIGMTRGLENSDRLQPSVAAALFAALKGASILRVHDVRETWEQFQLIHAILGETRD
jgi:dihydropteroate synthase